MFEAIRVNPPKPLICLEVNPPRGTDVDSIFARLEGKTDGVDFFNVTDCALAKMKLAALPFAALLKQRFGKEPLVNVSCRDRNLIALQADLLAGWALGIRSIVALTGDAVTIGDSPERKGVFEVNSLGLLHAILTLNAGHDLANNPLKGTPQYFCGAVVNPNARNIDAEIRRLKKKQAAGACYALSQPVFDSKTALDFLKAAAAVDVPIFLGLFPVKSRKALESIVKVPGIKVPDTVLRKCEGSSDAELEAYFLGHCMEIAAATRELVCGFHVVSGVTPLLALDLAGKLAQWAVGVARTK